MYDDDSKRGGTGEACDWTARMLGFTDDVTTLKGDREACDWTARMLGFNPSNIVNPHPHRKVQTAVVRNLVEPEHTVRWS
jgi:hypothetical protein